jgi:hypothetical protein
MIERFDVDNPCWLAPERLQKQPFDYKARAAEFPFLELFHTGLFFSWINEICFSEL